MVGTAHHAGTTGDDLVGSSTLQVTVIATLIENEAWRALDSDTRVQVLRDESERLGTAFVNSISKTKPLGTLLRFHRSECFDSLYRWLASHIVGFAELSIRLDDRDNTPCFAADAYSPSGTRRSASTCVKRWGENADEHAYGWDLQVYTSDSGSVSLLMNERCSAALARTQC